MPNRILRDWTDSETIDQLDVHTERFFTRLIMKVDDFGRYSANHKLLKSNLFPLRSDIRETDISRWITACVNSGLIVTYHVASKDYLQINNFKQVLRQKSAKYPSPDECLADDKQMLSNCIADASLKRNELEVETKEKEKGIGDALPISQDLEFSEDQRSSFLKFTNWIKENAPRVAKMKEPFTIRQYLSVTGKGYKTVEIQQLLCDMHNWADLLKKRESAYLTFINWKRREDGSK
jgi:hypothetical protein